MRVGRRLAERMGVSSSCVQQDWHAWLPANKAEVYAAYLQQLESVYNMFSVALNEAMELRRLGKLGKSCQAVYVIPAFCKRLADPLKGLLRALAEHAKNYRPIPSAVPLSPSNFQGIRSQRTARLNELLGRVLLSQRSQFLHKIVALQEMIVRLEQDFRVAAEELGMGLSVNPEADWRVVDISHYDLNTCLRESEILLKSFLISIPDDQIGAFRKVADGQMRSEPPSRSVHLVQPRRMAASGGK